jgi:hypothetical protein
VDAVPEREVSIVLSGEATSTVAPHRAVLAQLSVGREGVCHKGRVGVGQKDRLLAHHAPRRVRECPRQIYGF